jgi:outer membrane biosynthesis protein TonB
VIDASLETAAIGDAPADESSKQAEPVDAQVAAPEPAVTAVAKPRASRRSQNPRVAADSGRRTPHEDREPVAATPVTPAPSSGCEEVECVVEKYARPCCARYKPAGDGFEPDDGTSLDRPQIRAGVEKVKAKVIACGEQFTAKGTVKLAITVDGEGNVQELSVQTTPDDALGSCVAGVLRKARFAKTTNGGSFNYPFVF